MTKKCLTWFAGILLAAAVLFFLPEEALSAGLNEIESGSCGENVTWTYYDSGLLRIDGTGEMTFFTSADKVPWYSYLSEVKTVEMDNRITTVGQYAFYHCTSLSDAAISNNATYIGNYAFQGCSALTKINIPNRVEDIGIYAFQDCTALESVSLGNGVKTIEALAFDGCCNLADLTFGHSLLTIGNYAFSGCARLTGLTVPEGVTELGNGAFYYCSGLVRLSLPDTLTTVGNQAFSYCGNLEYIHTGNGITELSCLQIGENLKEIEIGNGITQFNEYTFSYHTALTRVELGDGLQTLCDRAFAGCTALSEVTGGNNLTTIGSHAFFTCNGLKSFFIADGVTSIGHSAFYGCTALTGITIPYGVTMIGNNAFCNCTGLTGITIPDSVTYLGERAFQGCTGLTGSITIPDSVTYLGEYAFYKCSGITEATVGSQVNTLTYGADLFRECTSLTRVTFRSGVTAIGGGAFFGCTSLTHVTIPDSVTIICGEAFRACTSLTNVALPNSVKEIRWYAFYGCSSLTAMTLPDGFSVIEGYLFTNCSRLSRITIPASIKSISDSAFDGCTMLSDLYYRGTKEAWLELNNGNSSQYYRGAKVHFGYQQSGTACSNIPKGWYQIHVVDSLNCPIADAAVTYASQSGTTDGFGNALFTRGTAGNPIITVTKTGYESYSNQNESYQKSSDGYETIVLFGTEETGFHLAYALYSPNSEMSDCTDLLTSTKTVSLPDTQNCTLIGNFGSETFYLQCGAKEDLQVKNYELWQEEKRIAGSPDGCFALEKSAFSEDGSCFIVVKTKDGRRLSTRINLLFEKTTVNGATGFSLLGNAATIQVADSVPYLGGTTVTMDLPNRLPVNFYLTNKGMRIAFNLKMCPSNKQSNEESFDKWWEEQKTTMKKALSLADKFGKTAARLVNKIMKEDYTPTQIEGISELSEKTFSLPGGKFTVQPVGYVQVEWGDTTAQGELYFFINSKSPVIGYQTVVGIVPVTVYVQGTANANVCAEISYDWENATFSCNGKMDINVGLDAFGGAGVRQTIGVGAYGKANVLTEILGFGTEKNIELEKVELTGELGIRAYLACFSYEKAFAHDTWHLYTKNQTPGEVKRNDQSLLLSVEDSNYLSGESQWLRTETDRSGTEALSALSSLLENTYHNAQPTMITGNNGLFAAFIRGDTDGKSYLEVTRYDGNSWKDPVRVDGNAICDNAPQLCSDNAGNIWLAYTKTDSNFDRNSLLSFAQNQSIIVGKIDPDTLQFTKEAEFTADKYLYLPRLTLVDEAPVLVWLSSSVTDEQSVLLPPTGDICCSVRESGVWSEKSTLVQVTAPVVQLCPGEKSGKLCVGYVSDTDNDLLTSSDRSLCVLESGAVKTVAQNMSGTLTFDILPGQENPSFLWNGDDVLVSENGMKVEVPGITGEYAVEADSVYFSAPTDSGSDLMAVRFYSDGSQSEVIQLTDGERYLECLSVSGWNGEDYALALHTDADISQDGVSISTNLVWCAVQPVSDLKITGLDYPITELVPGEETVVTVSVTNTGDCEISGITVLLDGTEAAQGGTLQPGECCDIPVCIICPAQQTAYTVSVQQDGKGNNKPTDSESFTLGFADLSVALAYETPGNGRMLTAKVTNTGVDAVSGSLIFYDEDGNAFGQTSLEELSSQESCIVRYSLGDDFSGQNGSKVYVEVTADNQEEIHTSDNIAWVTVPACENKMNIADCDLENGSITVQVTNVDDVAAVACAFYDENGRMLGIRTETPAAGKNTYVFAVDNKETVQVRAVLWDENFSPISRSQIVRLDDTGA